MLLCAPPVRAFPLIFFLGGGTMARGVPEVISAYGWRQGASVALEKSLEIV